MKAGYRAEKEGDYERALGHYQQALGEMEGVYPDLRNKALIAAHNRMGACYRAIGDRDAALSEFLASQALGDCVYAPKAIAKLEGNTGPVSSESNNDEYDAAKR